MLAAENGFLWLTQWLSEHNLDINQTTVRGHTALMFAASNGHLPVVQWLYLEKNANLRQKNSDNTDALHIAVFRGHTETANWLIGQGMVLNLKYFKLHPLRWNSNRNNVELLQYLLRQQLPPRALLFAMLDAAGSGDVPVLNCCSSAGISLQSDHYGKNCITEAAGRGSLATLEFLCHSEGDYGVNNEKKSCLKIAAEYGNLHIIQWFWARCRPSVDEQSCCLLTASISGHFHVVKWLYRQGVDIRAKNDRGCGSLSAVVRGGYIPILEWFCQLGEDLHQVEENGKGVLSMAIEDCQPQVARWLFCRGFRLAKRDVKCALYRREEQVLGMIFKMTSKIGRANFFHSCRLDEKLKLLGLLRLDGDNEGSSEEEADACFARFNQYNDNTLEHKCMATLANLIGQQSGTLEAGLKAVDSLPIPPVRKDDLRELVIINLE